VPAEECFTFIAAESQWAYRMSSTSLAWA